MLTIVIPVKNPKFLDEFVEQNRKILEKYPVVVIDAGGGERLIRIADVYVRINVPSSLWDARKLGYEAVDTPFVLNLDSDVVLPTAYIPTALKILQTEKVGAVTMFFKDWITRHIGVLSYGVSIWRTELLKKLYDYNPASLSKTVIKLSPSHFVHVGFPYCECLYMWEKLLKSGYELETVCMRAKHLRD